MKNRTLGSTLLVAGTTIGAGMLAMPITSAGMGFGFTLLLLVGLWLLLAFSGLLYIEVYQTAPQSVGLASLYEQYFGVWGRIIATFVLVIFMYAILAAYITGGGSLISGLLPTFINEVVTAKIAILIFTLLLGAFVIIGTGSVDVVNRFFFLIKLLVFAFVLLMMLPRVQLDNLMAMPLKYALILSATPIFFTSFGYHVVIPSIVNYLNKDIQRLRIAIIVGTAMPLVAYILWQLATHGVLSQSGFVKILNQDPTLNGLVNAIKQMSHSTFLGEAVRIFSALALITSFLGVSLSLFDCLKDLLETLKMRTYRPLLGVCTFTPPLIFALFYPDGFILALSYAGMMFAFFGLIMPTMLAWVARNRYPSLAYRVVGGKLSLILALGMAVLIMVIPFLIQLNYLPQVAG